MQPGGVARGLLRRGPFVDHRLGDALQLGHLVRRADVGGEFEAVAVGVEEVDRLEDAVMRRAEDVEAERLKVRLGGVQFVEAAEAQGDVLDPDGRVRVAAHFGLLGQLEEGEHVAVPGIEEDVHVRIIGAGRGHVVLGDRQLEIHAERLLVKLHRLLRILAAIGDVVDAFEFWSCHHTFSFTPSTPRSTWSRSIDSNRALKLPSPKPSL